MTGYDVVIGLEVHVHLATRSKLFCSCSTRFGAAPNSNVCEICAGMPGALPTPNKEAIRLAAMLGLATECEVNLKSRFARKNYFYPDLPNGYQISQFELPICRNGHIKINGGQKKIGITRIHMENDAGKNIHSEKENLSFVDLNRAGVPLVEIVSEPDISSAEEAVDYLKNLHSLVTYLGISDGNMEEGSFRCDANISLKKSGSRVLGTRAELKNLNSFRFVQKALEYEIERQYSLLSAGESVVQETRLYDSAKDATFSMRSKEEAEDYRYFPDPDLLPVEISSDEFRQWRKSLPEPPDVRCEKFMALAGLPRQEALNLVQNLPLANLFENLGRKADPKKVASFLLGPVARFCNERQIPFNPEFWKIGEENIGELLGLAAEGAINAKIAAELFPVIYDTGKSARELVKEKGLGQISDDTLIEPLIEKVLAVNPHEAQELRNGKQKIMSFFMGQIMRETKGKANPALVQKVIMEKISKLP